MFPNPQDALPLPASPSLERYKKIAKDLVAACKSGDEKAIGKWAREWVDGLVRLSGVTFTRDLPANAEEWINAVEDFARRTLREGCKLTKAQFVIARSHGFESWPKFAKHLQGSASLFEKAADAIISGDIQTLRRLLREQPHLVRARSAREHGATLLHYVSANGVEGYRQKTPPNIVEIAGLLLDAGAEVDATADVYGGGCTALGLTATSIHPEKAGVQEALMQTLLDRGASIEKPSGGRGQSIVMACLANGQPHAAAFLASRGATVGKSEQLQETLGYALWAAAHGGDPDRYIAILDALVAAGAKVPESYVALNARIDAWLSEHGSRAEPSQH